MCPWELSTCMKNKKTHKSDDVVSLIGVMVEVFGKRFDKIDDKIDGMATKEQVFALQTQVSSIEVQLRGEKRGRLPVRVADLEEEVFGNARI